MGLFGRLFGDKRPNDPPGTTYFVDHGDSTADPFVVKRLLPGQTTGDQDLKVMFKSASLVEASNYRDWLAGDAKTFRYSQASVDVGTRDS